MPRATAKAGAGKPLTGTLGPDPDGEYVAPEGSGAMVPLSDREIEAAIIASAGDNAVSIEIAGKILAAETVQDILGTTDPTESLVGVTFGVRGWKWAKSKFGNRSGAFVILVVVDVGGRERTVTSGSVNIMAALRAFEKTKLEIPPLTVRSSETQAGNTVYRFAQAA